MMKNRRSLYAQSYARARGWNSSEKYLLICYLKNSSRRRYITNCQMTKKKTII